MKKKLIIALILVLALTFTLLVACDDPQEQENPDVFTVTFAGESVSVASQKVNDGEKAMEPKDPVREGYVLKYWYLTDPNVPFDFNTAITGDITLNAFWEEDFGPIDPAKIQGEGTKENPYLIRCAQHFELMANKVNSGDEAFVNGYFKVTENIDLNGYAYKSVGTEENPFKGHFDGNGKTISNLKLSASIRSEGNKYYGLFGVTETANIYGFSLSNIDFDIASIKDGSNVNVIIGGAVAYSEISNLSNISVNGNITTFLMADNNAYIGSVCGYASNRSYDQAYISYVENCYADIQMDIAEESGEVGSLENGVVGGLIGYINNYNCTAAVLNCAVSGKVYGGKYCGGIVGYINGLTSVIDCLNTAEVEATSTNLTYVGGIVGIAFDDNVIMDCVSTGTVKGLKAAPSTYNYKSYAGGIVGYAESEDYTEYYTAGSDVVNSYYVTAATGADVITTLGNSEYAAGYFKSLDNIIEVTNWNKNCWTTANGVIRPSDKKAKDVAEKYVVTLKNGSESTALEKPTNSTTSYALLGSPDDLASKDGNVFWDWEFAGGIRHKFYVPVVKNITLTAHWQNVSSVVGAYKGVSSYTGKEVGSIVLNDDGTLAWYNSSVNYGSYKYDGQHVILNIHLGEISGELGGKSLVFDNTEGSATVTYSFTAYTPKIIGEYMSDQGNIITFSSDTAISYENENVNRGGYINGTYTISNSTTFIPSFESYLGGYLTPVNITLQNENAIVFNYVRNGENKSETFRKLGNVDYSAEGFIGEYYYAYVGSSSTSVDLRRIEFKANGVVNLISSYNVTSGRYYYIESTQTLKVIMESYVSNFKFDTDLGIVYGLFQRGYGLFRPAVMTKTSLGMLSAYTNFESSYKTVDYDYVFLFAIEGGANYAFVDDVFSLDYSSNTEVGEGMDITINGVKYRIYGNELKTVGAEEGTYTLNGATIKLDGVSVAEIIGGANAGKYYYAAHKDKIVDIILDTELIVFDFETAKANNGKIQLAEQDGKQGVWFRASAYDDGENPYYYKLVLDGKGHATLFYMPKDTNAYKLNWGVWGSYKQAAFGALVTFNEYHKDFKLIFYYEKNMAYCPEDSATIYYTVKGYNGPSAPPVFDENKAGSYVGEDESGNQLVLNLRKDLSGTLQGNPISNVVFNGGNSVFFTCNKVDYTLTFKQSGATLSSKDNSYELAFSGAITEVIPSGLCGLWTGIFQGYGASATDERGFLIEADGTIYYYSSINSGSRTQVNNVNYDASSYVITFSDASEFNWTLTYDVENQQFLVEGRNSESTTLTATLTKAE